MVPHPLPQTFNQQTQRGFEARRCGSKWILAAGQKLYIMKHIWITKIQITINIHAITFFSYG